MTATHTREGVILQQGNAKHHGRENHRRHHERSDHSRSWHHFAMHGIGGKQAQHQGSGCGGYRKPEARPRGTEVFRITQNDLKPVQRQACWGDGQVGRFAKSGQHHDEDRNLQEYDDCKCGGSQKLALGVQAPPPQRLSKRLDKPMTSSVRPVSTKDIAAPLGQSSVCKKSS